MKKINAGFTIIEIIVVIAIIAVLATIVTSATVIYIGKAKDAQVKANVSQIVKQLQVYYSEQSSFPATNDPGFESFKDGIISQDMQTSYGFNANPASSAFVVYGAIDSGGFFAQDSTGTTGEIENPPDPGVYIVQEGTGGVLCSDNSDCASTDGECYCSAGRCVACESGFSCESYQCNQVFSCNGIPIYGCDIFSESCCSAFGCSWNSGTLGSCSGSPGLSCGSLSGMCCSAAGCSWDPGHEGSCSGGAEVYCSSFSESCCSSAGCYWNMEMGSCEGTTGSCSGLGQGCCTGGCTWDPSVPSSCTGIAICEGAGSDCCSSIGCTWNNSIDPYCEGTPSCAGAGETCCGNMSGCSWE